MFWARHSPTWCSISQGLTLGWPWLPIIMMVNEFSKSAIGMLVALESAFSWVWSIFLSSLPLGPPMYFSRPLPIRMMMLWWVRWVSWSEMVLAYLMEW